MASDSSATRILGQVVESVLRQNQVLTSRLASASSGLAHSLSIPRPFLLTITDSLSLPIIDPGAGTIADTIANRGTHSLLGQVNCGRPRPGAFSVHFPSSISNPESSGFRLLVLFGLPSRGR